MTLKTTPNCTVPPGASEEEVYRAAARYWIDALGPSSASRMVGAAAPVLHIHLIAWVDPANPPGTVSWQQWAAHEFPGPALCSLKGNGRGRIVRYELGADGRYTFRIGRLP